MNANYVSTFSEKSVYMGHHREISDNTTLSLDLVASECGKYYHLYHILLQIFCHFCETSMTHFVLCFLASV